MVQVFTYFICRVRAKTTLYIYDFHKYFRKFDSVFRYMYRSKKLLHLEIHIVHRKPDDMHNILLILYTPKGIGESFEG